MQANMKHFPNNFSVVSATWQALSFFFFCYEGYIIFVYFRSIKHLVDGTNCWVNETLSTTQCKAAGKAVARHTKETGGHCSSAEQEEMGTRVFPPPPVASTATTSLNFFLTFLSNQCSEDWGQWIWDIVAFATKWSAIAQQFFRSPLARNTPEITVTVCVLWS